MFSSGVLASAAFALTAGLVEADDGGVPNILVILADDLGYGDLAVQGAEEMRTPHIDSLFEGGLALTNFYTNSPVCSPSRAALLTGKFPDLVGMPGVVREEKGRSWGYLSSQATLLPESLKEAGYQTALIGKWHLGAQTPNLPNDRGFDYYKGFLGGMVSDVWNHVADDGGRWMSENGDEIRPDGEHITELFTQWAIEYVKGQKDQNDPFFLLLAHVAPHAPIQPPDDWLDNVRKREPQLSDKRARYVAFVEHFDHNVGLFLDALRDAGRFENTLIVFTSDNGGAIRFGGSNGPLRGEKTQMFEGGIKAPCAVYWKGVIEPGRRSDNFAMLSDWLPTFCDIAGVPVSEKIDGISILPTLRGEQQVTDQRYSFWVRRDDNRAGGLAHYAARFGDLKLVQNTPFEVQQFFDLAVDPGEANPLPMSANPKFRNLRYALEQHIRKSGAVPWQQTME